MLVDQTVTRATMLGIAAVVVLGLIVVAMGTTSAPAVSGLRDIPVTKIVPPDGAYDPVIAGEPLPDGYRPVLPRDAILPVYNPTFRSVTDTDWPADALVIGVVIEDDARAYPVSFLTRREMVIDRVANIPVLVSW